MPLPIKSLVKELKVSRAIYRPFNSLILKQLKIYIDSYNALKLRYGRGAIKGHRDWCQEVLQKINDFKAITKEEWDYIVFSNTEVEIITKKEFYENLIDKFTSFYSAYFDIKNGEKGLKSRYIHVRLSDHTLGTNHKKAPFCYLRPEPFRLEAETKEEFDQLMAMLYAFDFEKLLTKTKK